MRITKERLREIIAEELKLETSVSKNLDNEVEDALEDILDRNDGPINRFGAINRALEMVKLGRELDVVANALYKALDVLGNDELSSTEF